VLGCCGCLFVLKGQDLCCCYGFLCCCCGFRCLVFVRVWFLLYGLLKKDKWCVFVHELLFLKEEMCIWVHGLWYEEIPICLKEGRDVLVYCTRTLVSFWVVATMLFWCIGGEKSLTCGGGFVWWW